mmetsp:Transcript_18103/g.59468  ORF Transcript_18103/g.59468 Transcript_18103/m.59468 type:complete len:356 (-) Transcript_18103:2192-3259(-)
MRVESSGEPLEIGGGGGLLRFDVCQTGGQLRRFLLNLLPHRLPLPLLLLPALQQPGGQPVHVLPDLLLPRHRFLCHFLQLLRYPFHRLLASGAFRLHFLHCRFLSPLNFFSQPTDLASDLLHDFLPLLLLLLHLLVHPLLHCRHLVPHPHHLRVGASRLSLQLLLDLQHVPVSRLPQTLVRVLERLQRSDHFPLILQQFRVHPRQLQGAVPCMLSDGRLDLPQFLCKAVPHLQRLLQVTFHPLLNLLLPPQHVLPLLVHPRAYPPHHLRRPRCLLPRLQLLHRSLALKVLKSLRQLLHACCHALLLLPDVLLQRAVRLCHLLLERVYPAARAVEENLRSFLQVLHDVEHMQPKIL